MNKKIFCVFDVYNLCNRAVTVQKRIGLNNADRALHPKCSIPAEYVISHTGLFISAREVGPILTQFFFKINKQ